MNKFNDADFFSAMSEIGLHFTAEQTRRITQGEKNEKDTLHCRTQPGYNERTRCTDTSLPGTRSECR